MSNHNRVPRRQGSAQHPLADPACAPTNSAVRPSRRDLLRRAVAASLTTAPLFVTLGARGAESSAYEQAQQFLGNAQRLISKARNVAASRRRELATEAQTELTEAKAAARSASAAEQRQLRDPMEAAAADIEELLADGRD